MMHSYRSRRLDRWDHLGTHLVLKRELVEVTEQELVVVVEQELVAAVERVLRQQARLHLVLLSQVKQVLESQSVGPVWSLTASELAPSPQLMELAGLWGVQQVLSLNSTECHLRPSEVYH